MKSKSGGGLFGIFKKKTTPAPAAPPPQNHEHLNSKRATTEQETTTSFVDPVTSASTLPESSMPPRKGSYAQTSVIHYSPPGTVRASLPPSARSSVISGGSEDSGTVVVTRKSNILLDDEESVISTPISQYDEAPIVHKPRSKRAAPPPPPPQPAPESSTSSSKPMQNGQHSRQISTISMNSEVSVSSPPPPPPPHKKAGDGMDYEAMLENLRTKFEEWNQLRLEDGGSMKEERIKAEVYQEHEKLRSLLDKQITSDRPKSSPSTSSNNNNNVKKQLPLKMPNYGNFYAQPTSSPSPPARVGAVPGGVLYQKTSREKKSSSTSSPTIAHKPKTDENRNEVAPKKKISETAAQNSEAVNRLRREVEEQRQREKEVKQYRNPKALEVQVKSPEPARKSRSEESQVSPPKSPGPRMVEYKPMKSPGRSTSVEEYPEVAPPIPKNPPPKLAEYRKEQQVPISPSAPRMPTVPSNGYVRLQMNGATAKKVAAPSAPTSLPKTPYTGPEFAASPKLLRKTPEPSPSSPQKPVPPVVKEDKKIYEKPPQMHPQAVKVPSPTSPGGILTATSSSSPQFKKNQPPMTRAVSVDQNVYKVSSEASPQRKSQPTVPSSPVIYRKTQGQPYRPSQVSPLARAVSTDQPTIPSPSTQRKISAPPIVLSPQAPRKGYASPGILSVTSATSPPYPKGSVGPTVISIGAPPTQRKQIPAENNNNNSAKFDISDVLKGPKLRKVGMPVERNGFSVGKIVETEPSSNRPSATPPPPPPPPPAPIQQAPAPSAKNGDLRDSLMSEIREAGRLRAARASQTA